MEQLFLHLSQFYTKNDLESRRLFHGRGKCIPELDYLTIDFFPPVIFIIFYREPPPELLPNLESYLLKIYGGEIKSIYVQKRFILPALSQLIWGENNPTPIVQLHGLKFKLNLGAAQNIGIFLDMENGRKWLFANGKNKKILNLFAYTCALSVVALHAGARTVTNIDMAKNELKRGEENHRLNNFLNQNVKFVSHNILKSFSYIKKSGPYDIVIIDPPTAQGDSFKIDRDYGKIISRLGEWVSPGGEVMAVLNSPHHHSDFLIELFKNNADQFTLLGKYFAPDPYREVTPESGLKILIWRKNE